MTMAPDQRVPLTRFLTLTLVLILSPGPQAVSFSVLTRSAPVLPEL